MNLIHFSELNITDCINNIKIFAVSLQRIQFNIPAFEFLSGLVFQSCLLSFMSLSYIVFVINVLNANICWSQNSASENFFLGLLLESFAESQSSFCMKFNFGLSVINMFVDFHICNFIICTNKSYEIKINSNVLKM